MMNLHKNSFLRIPWITVALVALVALVVISYSPQIARIGQFNIGMLMINRGLMTKNGTEIVKGQSVLFQIPRDYFKSRYSNFLYAEFNPNNLLVNGSFEFNGWGWVIGAPDASIATTWTTEYVFSGLQSLVINFDDSESNFYHTYQNVSVEPNTCYLLQAQTKADNLTDIVALEIWDAKRGYQHWYGGRTTTVEGTTDWTAIFLHFCTEGDIQSIQVRIRRYGGHDQTVSGTVWIDDVFLRISSQK